MIFCIHQLVYRLMVSSMFQLIVESPFLTASNARSYRKTMLLAPVFFFANAIILQHESAWILIRHRRLHFLDSRYFASNRDCKPYD